MEKFDILEDILKRNSDSDAEIDLRGNEVDHYFFFDKISNQEDLETAWGTFPQHEEIRRRANEVDRLSDVVEGWGYRLPKDENQCAPEELVQLVHSYIKAIRALIPEDDDFYKEVTGFIDADFEVQIAPSDASMPGDDDENPLMETLYEVISEFVIEHFPDDEPEYEVLYNWAIYLTKCDEVAAYLLWPCLRDIDEFDSETPNAGFRLWLFDCRARYWVKDGDFTSGVVYLSPPPAN